MVSLLLNRTFFLITALAGIVGLYFVSRQWEAFKGTFPYVFTLEGAAISLLSITLIKSLHELGHAYVAHRYGCRVPTMGVAMMVLMPLLYTDVSDAWRLKSRKQRLAIDSAGMLVEFAVAAYALLLWSFLPDGPLRSAVFVIAAVGWVLSIIVNTNPFMRFDGYYILADAVGIENLQPRAFRHMRWRLREFLFAQAHPHRNIFRVASTLFSDDRHGHLQADALLGYRASGLSFLHQDRRHHALRGRDRILYHPPGVARTEGMVRHASGYLASPRSYITFAALGVGIALVFIAVSTRVSAPAVLQPELFARLFPQEPGRVTAVRSKRGQEVRQGDILFEISSPPARRSASWRISK